MTGWADNMEDLKQRAKRDLISAVRRWLRYAASEDLSMPVALAELLDNELRIRSRDVAQKVINSEA